MLPPASNSIEDINDTHQGSVGRWQTNFTPAAGRPSCPSFLGFEPIVVVQHPMVDAHHAREDDDTCKNNHAREILSVADVYHAREDDDTCKKNHAREILSVAVCTHPHRSSDAVLTRDTDVGVA
jgi:hypothetical protein